MATYPYISGTSALVQTFAQLKKGFPTKVDAGYLQRFKLATANESYIISILRFLELINEDGDRIDENTNFFFGGEEVFKPGFDKQVRAAYSQVFDEMGEDTTTATREALTNWFRAADKTSELVGTRQATTFQVLLALAGHADVPAVRVSSAKKTTGGAETSKASTASKPAGKSSASTKPQPNPTEPTEDFKAKVSPDVGLTVRIEVNLPPSGDAATYDAIFASIKKHLM